MKEPEVALMRFRFFVGAIPGLWVRMRAALGGLQPSLRQNEHRANRRAGETRMVAIAVVDGAPCDGAGGAAGGASVYSLTG